MSVVPFPLSRQRGWIARHLSACRHYSSAGMSSYLSRRIEEYAARLAGPVSTRWLSTETLRRSINGS